jgi:hypothetical protein
MHGRRSALPCAVSATAVGTAVSAAGEARWRASAVTATSAVTVSSMVMAVERSRFASAQATGSANNGDQLLLENGVQQFQFCSVGILEPIAGQGTALN